MILLEVRGFSRGLDPKNLEAAIRLVGAFRLCRREMKSWMPQVVAAFGGYASVPGAVAALSLGVPLVIHEQNVIPGLANRLLAPGAKAMAISFEDTLERCPRWRKKAVVTGNPMVSNTNLKPEENPWACFGLDEGRKTVAVVGGSQGAASLNRAVLEALALWRNRDDLQVVHSVGRDKYQEFMSQAAKVDSGCLVYRPLEFIERMDLLYRAADLVVCRAGASTISELAVEGCASVLVPYPFATAAHQDANAAVMERAGAARVIGDHEFDGRRLKQEVDGLLADPWRLHEMRVSSFRMGKPGAAARLADLVLSLA